MELILTSQYKEVNCTVPSRSVRLPCSRPLFDCHWNLIEKRKENIWESSTEARQKLDRQYKTFWVGNLLIGIISWCVHPSLARTEEYVVVIKSKRKNVLISIVMLELLASESTWLHEWSLLMLKRLNLIKLIPSNCNYYGLTVGEHQKMLINKTKLLVNCFIQECIILPKFMPFTAIIL